MESTRTAGGTNTGDRRTVVGVFDGPRHAEQALNDLKDSGFTPEQVSVVARDNRETRDMVESTGMGGEGAGTGAFLGGITGGILGWMVGIGALAIPGVGPIVAAGALATTLGGAALGAVAGGLIGALTDMGVPEEHAKGYEENVRQGSILLTVSANTDEQARQAHGIFNRHGGSDVRGYGFESDGADEAGAGRTRDSSDSGAMRDRGTARRDDDDSAAPEMTAGSVVGGSAGAIGGGLVGGPPGAVAGGLIGGSAGAAAGGAANDAADDDDDELRRTRGSGTGGTSPGTSSGGRQVIDASDVADDKNPPRRS